MDSRRMCPHCRAFITNKDRVCPYCNEPVGERAVDRRDPNKLLAGFIPQGRFNTIVILLINFALYAATALYGMNIGRGDALNLDGLVLVLFGAKFGPAVAQGDWWRLITAGFLHGGILHILMNSWVLFDLGATVEEVYGGSRMYVIYFVSSVLGFYASYAWKPYAVSVGASAALFGLIGAMIALGLRHRSAIGDAMRGQYIRWAVYMLIFSLVIPQIDMAAHVGGLVGGFGVAYLAGQPRYEGAPSEKLWTAAAWVAVLLTAYAMFQMYMEFSRFAHS